jgi:hypothetical protein
LPRPIIIPDLLTLETLADVRVLVEKHLPAEYKAKFTWRQLAGLLKRAAEGQQDISEVTTALRSSSSWKASNAGRAAPLSRPVDGRRDCAMLHRARPKWAGSRFRLLRGRTRKANDREDAHARRSAADRGEHCEAAGHCWALSGRRAMP